MREALMYLAVIWLARIVPSGAVVVAVIATLIVNGTSSPEL